VSANGSAGGLEGCASCNDLADATALTGDHAIVLLYFGQFALWWRDRPFNIDFPILQRVLYDGIVFVVELPFFALSQLVLSLLDQFLEGVHKQLSDIWLFKINDLDRTWRIEVQLVKAAAL
jgi:hypothetical protein